MYLHIVGTNAYGSYYTESQSIGFSEYDGIFDGRNLKLSYLDNNGKERTITGTLSSDIVFSGKHNSKNVNLSLANTHVNFARIEEYEDDFFSDKKFIFNVRALNNLDYYGRFDGIAYLDENIIIFYDVGFLGGYWAYYINSGKEITLSDFISNSFLKKLEPLVPEEVRGEGAEFSFYITPDRKIGFYFNPGTMQAYIEGYVEASLTPVGSGEEFTFEEIKPYIKKGSPLDYLFNWLKL